MNNLARSVCMLDRGRPAGAQSVAKCTDMALQLLPLHHTVINLVSMGHLAIKTRHCAPIPPIMAWRVCTLVLFIIYNIEVTLKVSAII